MNNKFLCLCRFGYGANIPIPVVGNIDDLSSVLVAAVVVVAVVVELVVVGRSPSKNRKDIFNMNKEPEYFNFEKISYYL